MKCSKKKATELFEKALKRFEEQFGVSLDPTSYEHSFEENCGIKEVEYWANDLIKTEQISGLDFEVGGWFSCDVRDQLSIHCFLAIKLNGESIHDGKALQSWYDIETERWDVLDWDSF